jgi:hypothetical protein
VDGRPNDVPTPNRSISGLYQACRASAEEYCRSGSNREVRLFQTLGRALELYRLSEETPQNQSNDKSARPKKMSSRPVRRSRDHRKPDMINPEMRGPLPS